MILGSFSAEFVNLVYNVTLVACRSSHERCSMKKSVLKNFAKFTEKHLCQSLFFNLFIKKRLRYKCFPLNLVIFLGTPFSQNTTG